MPVDRGARVTRRLRASGKPKPDYERQRREAVARDGKFCQAEVVRSGPADGPGTRVDYERCGAVACATAHIYRRRLCGSVPDHVDVVIRTCLTCHDKLDNRQPNDNPYVMFPIEAKRRAWDRIIANSKDKSTIGPRP